jgi:regulator of protease activity HflC (stomatin/prohibitin superfamily)
MAYEPDNHAPTKSRELDYLVKALGIDELYERLNKLDSLGDLPKSGSWNPTGNPMVQRNFHGEVGSLSSGPNEENVGRLDIIDPDHIKKIEALAEVHEAEAKERADAEEAKRAEQDSEGNQDAEKSQDELKSEEKTETPKTETKVSTPASRASAKK